MEHDPIFNPSKISIKKKPRLSFELQSCSKLGAKQSKAFFKRVDLICLEPPGNQVKVA